MSMAYKPYEIWYPKGLLSGILVYFLLLFFSFFEDYNKGCPICRKFSFGEIFSQRLTKSPDMWN